MMPPLECCGSVADGCSSHERPGSLPDPGPNDVHWRRRTRRLLSLSRRLDHVIVRARIQRWQFCHQLGALGNTSPFHTAPSCGGNTVPSGRLPQGGPFLVPTPKPRSNPDQATTVTYRPCGGVVRSTLSDLRPAELRHLNRGGKACGCRDCPSLPMRLGLAGGWNRC